MHTASRWSRGVAERTPTVLPAMPAVTGRNPTRAAFFREAAGAFEFMALWHSLDAPAQAALSAAMQAASASVAHDALKGKQ